MDEDRIHCVGPRWRDLHLTHRGKVEMILVTDAARRWTGVTTLFKIKMTVVGLP